jgi:hypothetical protein
MRVRVGILVTLAALLMTGCAAGDVSSLDKLLRDLGIPQETTTHLAEALRNMAIKPAEEAIQTGAEKARDFLSQIRNVRLEIPSGIRLAIIGVGLALLLAGQYLYRAAVAAPGFALGMVIGTTVLSLAEELPDLVVLGVAALIGLVGAGLALAVHDLAVVLIGALVSGFLAFSLLVTYNIEPSLVFALIVGTCAVAGAIGLLLVARSMRFLLGAILGAALVSIGVVENLNLLIIVPLALVGTGIQLSLKNRRPRKRARREPDEQQPPLAPKRFERPSPALQPADVFAEQPQPSYPPPAAPAAFPPLKPEGQPPQAQPQMPGWAPGIEAPAPSRAMLTLWGEAGPVQTVPIGASLFTIGSEPTSHLMLPDLAPTHATIRPSPAGYYLESQVSPYGTLVNGRPVRATYLAHGDVLRLGAHELRFSCTPAAQAT